MPITHASDSLVTRNLSVEQLLALGPDTPLELKEMPAPGTPLSGAVLVYAKSDGKVYSKNDAGTEFDLTTGGGGEANTASNVGTAGVGVFKQKVGVDLQFKKLNAGSTKITITDDTANNEIDVDVGALDAGVIASGTLASARIAAAHRTVARVLYIENPTAADEFPLAYVPDAATLVAVRAVTDVGTVDFNIERRSKLTPDVTGSNVWSADKQATASGLEQTTFDAGAVSAEEWLHYSASAVGSSPTKLWISVEYAID